MPYKDIEKQRAAYRKHYRENKQWYFEKAKKQRDDKRKWIQDMKEASPCKDCNTYYPYYVMDYDHKENKRERISVMVQRGLSKETILKEIEKCDLLCSNCHRIRTQKRKSE